MIQRYSIYADGYYSVDENDNGLYCLYADAEKWKDECVDRALATRETLLKSLERKLEKKDEEIAKLKADNENMAKLNDSFPEEIVRLEDEIAALTAENRRMWEALTTISAINDPEETDTGRIAQDALGAGEGGKG